MKPGFHHIPTRPRCDSPGPGQLVLFDNRITQHYAPGNYDGAPRRLNRVTVAGDIPVGIDGQPSFAIAGDASRYTAVAG